MLERQSSYRALVGTFGWRMPDPANIAWSACEAWAEREPGRTAIIEWRDDATTVETDYRTLSEASNRFANTLANAGIGPGDRVALLLPQTVETAIAHLAIYKRGAVAVPLALLFGADAIQYRLNTAGVSAVVTNRSGLEKLQQIEGERPAFKAIYVVDGAPAGTTDFHEAIGRAKPEFDMSSVSADTPALMIFTSGTTGPPKGALHGHRVLAGHLPGVQMPHEFLPQPGDRLWTPADWAWAGGLLNILLPGLALGVPVVCSRMQKFDPASAYRLMAETHVRNAFIPPTALKMMMAAGDLYREHDLNLRTIGSGGEALGREALEWSRQAFGLDVNEFYGQTECNLVLSSCAGLGVLRPGAIGKPVPGHDVAIIGEDGHPCAAGETGQIAVRRPDPVMFLEYWQNPQATEEKFIGDWMMTGDQGVVDEDGYFTFVGRDDDIITSSGYRIGPGEIEDCLLTHPAVALAAAIGKPDRLRTEIVKAFIVPTEGFAPGEALKGEIAAHVRNRLSAHEYPREIEFVDSLPLTTTGKVIRRALRDRESGA